MPNFDLSQLHLPTFGPYQLAALIFLGLVAVALVWIARTKPHSEIKILGLFQITLSDKPAAEPKKPVKKSGER